MIPTTFNEETEFFSDSNTNSLKRHYMTFYWKVSKDFLDYIEDSMSQDTLIGSTISTSNLDSLKRHYMIFYWKVCKDYLDFLRIQSLVTIKLVKSVLDPRRVFLAPVRLLPQMISHLIYNPY
jgi:hypothetical protein